MVEDMNNQDAIISRQPTASDTQEQVIRDRLNILVSTEWGRATINELREKQEFFLHWALEKLSTPQAVRLQYEKLMDELAALMKTTIVSGKENLDKIPAGTPFIVVTNHLGTAKLTRIDNHNGLIPAKIDEIEPFPIRPSVLSLIAQHRNASIYETAIELPTPLSDIQRACGVIIVSPSGHHRIEKLISDVKKLVQKNLNSLIVMYPEGGTSGKRNNGGPYDLDEFHSGAFVTAMINGLPILPVCQYFHPEFGMQLYILNPITLTQSDIKNRNGIAQSIKEDMQLTLNQAAYSR